jgi:hypothetical protein
MDDYEGVNAMEWIRRAADYRVIVGKRDSLGFPLVARELERLGELERFFGRDANRRRSPWASREQLRSPARLVVQLGDTVGYLRDLSGDGMFIETSRPLSPGARTVVRVNEAMQRGLDGIPFNVDEEPATVDEWRFAAEVVRVDIHGMGLRLVGIPLQLRITHHGTTLSPSSPQMHAA